MDRAGPTQWSERTPRSGLCPRRERPTPPLLKWPRLPVLSKGWDPMERMLGLDPCDSSSDLDPCPTGLMTPGTRNRGRG